MSIKRLSSLKQFDISIYLLYDLLKDILSTNNYSLISMRSWTNILTFVSFHYLITIKTIVIFSETKSNIYKPYSFMSNFCMSIYINTIKIDWKIYKTFIVKNYH